MPKVQLRLPKATSASQTLPGNGKVVEMPRKAKTAQAVQEATPTANGKQRAPRVAKTPTPEPTPTPARPAKPTVSMRTKTPRVVETPPAAVETPVAVQEEPRQKRAPRLRGRVDVKKFLPRVERAASLRTVRAIEYLTQLEQRAVETRRMPKGTEFPMSILEMKALNEAIKIMQIKYALEQEDIQNQKAAQAASKKSA